MVCAFVLCSLAVVTGTDGHHALLPWAEIDPGRVPVLLAVTIDATPLDRAGPRLVPPRDRRGPRTPLDDSRTRRTHQAGHTGLDEPALSATEEAGSHRC